MRRKVLKSLVIGFAILVSAVAVTGGLAVGLVFYQSKRAPAGNSQYVALGSSFAAAPGAGGLRAPDSPMLCMRSAVNYPHELAKLRRLNLTDMTCSGATARNVLLGGQYFQGPQINALRETTELVTFTAGGNDVSYLPNVLGWACANAPERIPASVKSMVCRVADNATVETQFADLGATMRSIADEVHRRSPHAKLVFADYTTVLPERGSCPDRLPLTVEQLQRGREVAARLSALTEQVASQTGSLFLKVSELSKGHDICSDDPWVFGLVFPTTPWRFTPMAFHPNEVATARTAEGLDRLLESSRSP